ncbi:hypothetical protein D9M69_682720 [compost metagenome]
MSTSASGSSMEPWKSLPLGRITMSAPAKPPAMSHQVSAGTRSCSSGAASTVMASGTSMRMAVKSPTGT